MGVIVRQKTRGKGKPWWIFIFHNGKRTSKKIGDKNAAEKVASTIRAKLKLGEFNFEPEKPKPTFKEYAESFLNGFSKNNHKPSTQESYKSALENHIYPVFGSKSIDKIRKKDINPFTWDEKAEFEKAAEEHYPRYYPLFLTGLRTGMRMGELIALKPGDLDFNGNFIEIRRNCVRGIISTPKSDKIRRVDMSSELRRVLKSFLTSRKQEALRKGWGQPPEWLFYNKAGNLIHISHPRKRVFYRVLEKAGLRKIRMHDMRHAYATLRIQSGHNIADVSKQLGHHSINITVDTYYLTGYRDQQI